MEVKGLDNEWINIKNGFGFETHKFINLRHQESQFFAWSENQKSRKSKKKKSNHKIVTQDMKMTNNNDNTNPTLIL